MIRIVAIGFILAFFSACKTHSVYQSYGRMLQEAQSFYLNDSLKISYAFGGDYVETKNKDSIRSRLKQFQLQKWRKYLLEHFYTIVPPSLEHFTFFIPQKNIKKIAKYPLRADSTLLDTLNDRLLLYKFKAINNAGTLVMAASSTKKEFINLRYEYTDRIFTSIKPGEDFKSEISFTDPFSLADERALNQDSTVNYLLPLTQLIEAKENYREPRDENLYIQALATYYSRINNSNSELNTLMSQWKGKTYMAKRNGWGLHIKLYDNDVINEIVKQCKDQRIVMINENHFQPNNRFLVHLLIDRLYQEGFTYFGLESLWENKDSLNTRKFCISSSGFYTKAPSMSNLINHAIETGYKVFGYDYFTEQRDLDQAKNIYNATFKADPNAKVLILAGFGHISEKESARNWMAAEFSNQFNIDPLTIEQTQFDLPLDDHFLGLIDTVNLANKKKMLADIYLTNNLTYDAFSRLMGFSRYEIPIDIQYKRPSMLSIYDAAHYSADSTAIPVFNYMLDQTNKQKIEAYLPPKNYILKIKNATNKLLHTDTLKVD